MILKEAEGHIADIAELERLKEDASATLQAKIDKQILNFRAGDAGERNAAHYINREFGRSEMLGILHDLRIGVDGDFAQIDHLLIHRFQKTAWILETKNFAGNLSCDEHGDWTVWRGKKPFPVASPVNQARRQASLLQRWLEEHKIVAIRKIVPVVLISPTSSVNRKHLSADAIVVKSDNFPDWWAKETDKLGVGKVLGMFGRHLANGMSREELAALGKRLSDAHVPLARDWRAAIGLLPENAAADRSTVRPQPAAPVDVPCPSHFAREASQVVATPYGDITISQLPDGRLALRNDKNDDLIDIVRSSCRGRARWNPRYRNWVFHADHLAEIKAKLSSNLRGVARP